MAGGCSDGEAAYIVIMGLNVPSSLPITFRGPDLTGDRAINLSDIVVFTQALTGGYESCADFSNDGVINLEDIVIMAQGIGRTCP
jgi:hypothetical protein